MNAFPDARESITSKAARPSTAGLLRRGYFALCALWGFLAGAGAMAIAQRVDGVPLAALLGLGAAAAVAGGLVCAAAYREARRHGR